MAFTLHEYVSISFHQATVLSLTLFSLYVRKQQFNLYLILVILYMYVEYILISFVIDAPRGNSWPSTYIKHVAHWFRLDEYCKITLFLRFVLFFIFYILLTVVLYFYHSFYVLFLYSPWYEAFVLSERNGILTTCLKLKINIHNFKVTVISLFVNNKSSWNFSEKFPAYRAIFVSKSKTEDFHFQINRWCYK